MEGKREVSRSVGLDELVESRLRELIIRVSEGSAQDIEHELTSLAALIDAYNRKDELLEKLLDPVTTADDRQQIKESLKSQRVLIARNRAELERLHTKSRNLLERSIQLLLEANKQAYKRSNGPEYSPERCGYCEGFGRKNRTECPACHGERLVLVHQPALACRSCNGTGKADPHDRVKFARDLCIVCRGKGWAFTRRNRATRN